MRASVTFDLTRPETHLVGVRLRLPPGSSGERRLRMPAWVPGSYQIRDFGRHVQDLTAKVAGRSAPVERTGKDEWTVPGTAGRPVVLEYAVYCRDLAVDMSHVTGDHGHLHAGTLVLYDAGSRELPHHVSLELPRGWRVWTGLETDALDGTLAPARDYDHLIDCPIEAGPPDRYELLRFQVRGRPHRLVVWHPPRPLDWRPVARELRAIATHTHRLFGDMPCSHYTFLIHVAADHRGGLEHRNSTVLGADPLHLLSRAHRRQEFLPMATHEYIHTWLVKGIRPAAFVRHELQREIDTGLLWLFEGFTTYYVLPLVYRAGVVDDDTWGRLGGDVLRAYESNLGRRRLSLSDASRLAWTLLYRPHEHNLNRYISYYVKGMLVALCLDAHLRERAVPGGLDRVMRLLWRRHGGEAGLGESDFANLVEEATGVDVSRQLRRWTESTAELPVERALRALGLEARREWSNPRRRVGLGVHFAPGTGRIERIPEAAPAAAVLEPGDEIVAVEGYRFREDRLGDLCALREPGDTVELALFRDGRLRVLKAGLMALPPDRVRFVPAAGGAARRRAWLGRSKSPAAPDAPATKRRNRSRSTA